MSALKPIKLYGLGRASNPLKVAMILEELNLPYEPIPIPFQEVKQPAYLAINPNGRLPAIEDPNTNLTLWESGAIVEYLIETYDKEHKLSFAPDTPDFWHARQWLYFQTSGQGPYYGQLGWFKIFEKLPNDSAVVQRYVREADRVSSVLESRLEKQKSEHPNAEDGPWLVGGKCSYVDIAFVPWQHVFGVSMKDVYDQGKYPRLQGLFERVVARPAVKRALDAAAKLGAH